MNREEIERNIDEMSLSALKDHRDYVMKYIGLMQRIGGPDTIKIADEARKSLEVIRSKIYEMSDKLKKLSIKIKISTDTLNLEKEFNLKDYECAEQLIENFNDYLEGNIPSSSQDEG